MSETGQNEEDFFIVFEEFIKTFTEDRKIVSNEKKGFSKEYIMGFGSGAPMTPLDNNETAASFDEGQSNTRKLDRKFIEFMETLEKTTFRHYIIPYDVITQSVFDNTPEEDLDEFTENLRTRGNSYFLAKEDESPSPTQPTQEDLDYEKMYYKILRHINLALVQKYTLTRIQIKEIVVLKREQQQLISRYDQLKQEAETQYRNMLTQFITILGIFAAVLMGAFGSIHAFTNLFTNAHKLDLGILLILSSIGASSVILILFFLLNGIAKLTERSLWSTKKPDGTLLEKHPSLIIIHGILIFISFIGASLELSNVNLQYAVQGYWWLVPGFWLTYFFTAIHKKDFLFFIAWIKILFTWPVRKILAYVRQRKTNKLIVNNEKSDRSNE